MPEFQTVKGAEHLSFRVNRPEVVRPPATSVDLGVNRETLLWLLATVKESPRAYDGPMWISNNVREMLEQAGREAGWL